MALTGQSSSNTGPPASGRISPSPKPSICRYFWTASVQVSNPTCASAALPSIQYYPSSSFTQSSTALTLQHGHLTTTNLAAAYIAYDGDVSPAELDHMTAHIEPSLQLTSDERTRLHAHLQRLGASEVMLTGPTLLELDIAVVTSRVPAVASAPNAAAAGPVTARQAGNPDPGVPIPAPLPLATQDAPPASPYLLDSSTTKQRWPKPRKSLRFLVTSSASTRLLSNHRTPTRHTKSDRLSADQPAHLNHRRPGCTSLQPRPRTCRSHAIPLGRPRRPLRTAWFTTARRHGHRQRSRVGRR